MTRPRAVAAAGTLAFGGGFAALSVLQHRAFWSGRFDVGNLVQAVWSTAHGDVLSVTGLRGEQISRLGAHFDPIVALLAPLWWVWPDASLLLVTQSAAVASGAIPVFLLARRHLGSEWAASGFVLAYLAYPATQWLVVDDFHPVAFATPLLLFGFWYLEQGRLAPFGLVAVLACTTKEQVGLTVAAMGLWYALRTGRRRVGLAIAVAGATVSLLAVTVVVPHFSVGGGSPFSDRYASVGGTPGGILRVAATDPGAIAAAVSETRDLAYLGDLLLPLALLPLLAPLTALTALPELALNLLSDTRTQTSIHFHYTAPAIPGLFVAAIMGTAALRRRVAGSLPVAARGIVIAAIVGGIVLGPLPVWRHVPGGSELGTREHVVTDHARAASRAVSRVPDGAVVSATNTIGAHLSERRTIFSFPVVNDATWVVVDTERPSHLDRAVAPLEFARALDRLRRDGRFVQVADDDGVLVFRRR